MISSMQRTLPDYTQHSEAPDTYVLAGLETGISICERQQIDALEPAATTMGQQNDNRITTE